MLYFKKKTRRAATAFKNACLNIRQFEDECQKISEDDIQELLPRASSGPSRQTEVYRSAICGQALINAKKARILSESLINRISQLTFEGGTEVRLAPLGEMLEVSLFDTYRDADPLFFDNAEIYIDLVEKSFGREQISPTPMGDRTIYYAVHFGLTPLLHTEHQTAAARLLATILDSWDQRTWSNVMPVLRLDKLRQFVLAPRMLFDQSAISDLRLIAARQASRQADASEVDLGEDSTSYFRHTRNLVLAMRYDEVSHKLKRYGGMVSADDDRVNSDFINFVSFVHESSLDTQLVVEAEKSFRKIGSAPSAFQYITMCRRLADVERGTRWIKTWEKTPASAARRFIESTYYSSIGEFGIAREMGSRVLSTFSSAHQTNAFGKVQSAILYRLTREVQTARFLADIEAVRASVAEQTILSAPAKNVSIVLVPAHVNFTMQMPILAIEAAKSQGAEVSCMVRGMYLAGEQLHPATKMLDQSLVAPYFFRAGKASHEVSAQWDIRLAERSMRYKGVEYYPGMMNSLGIIFRRFTIDFSDPLVAAQVDRHLVMFQSIHDLFEEFEAVASPDRIYRFAVVGIQYGIGYALRRLVEKSANPNLNILHLSNGFEGFDAQWQSDDESGNPIASYHSVTDLTGRSNTPLGFRPTPEDVDRVHSLRVARGDTIVNDVAAAYIAKVTERYGSASPYDVNAVTDHAFAHGKDGSSKTRPRRVLMLGTVLPDLSIPEDRGFIHRDLVDWVEATIRLAKDQNVQILVKQHPAEINHKIGFYIAEKFIDLIRQRSDHIVILPYDANFYSTLKACDLVTMWAGTSAIELALLGVPFICCSRFANEEYPLNIPGPTSEADYADILSGKRNWQCPPDAAARATTILNMTTSSPFRESSKEPMRQLLNAQVWPPRMDRQLPMDEAALRLTAELLGRR